MVGDVLRSLREQNGLTQKQVSEIMKIDRSTYSYYETGRTVPDMYTLAVLSRIYNITPEYMMSLCYGKASGNKQVELQSNAVVSSFSGSSEYLSELNRDEQNLILYFRQMKNKDNALKYMKECCFEDLDKMKKSFFGSDEDITE